MSGPTVFVLPGYGDSGPEHWQSHWERMHGYRRVVQSDWERPDRDAWVTTLAAAVAETAGPIVLVAHSLGCALVAHWQARTPDTRVIGALLVAPADVDEIQHYIPEIATFAPLPLARLPFPTIVVASATDPYVEAVRARMFAAAWGARLVEIGDAGHVNAEAGFGPWADGHALAESLMR